MRHNHCSYRCQADSRLPQSANVNVVFILLTLCDIELNKATSLLLATDILFSRIEPAIEHTHTLVASLICRTTKRLRLAFTPAATRALYRRRLCRSSSNLPQQYTMWSRTICLPGWSHRCCCNELCFSYLVDDVRVLQGQWNKRARREMQSSSSNGMLPLLREQIVCGRCTCFLPSQWTGTRATTVIEAARNNSDEDADSNVVQLAPPTASCSSGVNVATVQSPQTHLAIGRTALIRSCSWPSS